MKLFFVEVTEKKAPRARKNYVTRFVVIAENEAHAMEVARNDFWWPRFEEDIEEIAAKECDSPSTRIWGGLR